MPLYFQIDEFRVRGTIWYQPAIMYYGGSADGCAAHRVGYPIAGRADRRVDVVLMFLLVRRLSPEASPAWLAAILLALSPAHFTHSRFAMDYIYPLPFILGWLLCAVDLSRGPAAGGPGDRRALPGPRLLQLHRGGRPDAGVSRAHPIRPVARGPRRRLEVRGRGLCRSADPVRDLDRDTSRRVRRDLRALRVRQHQPRRRAGPLRAVLAILQSIIPVFQRRIAAGVFNPRWRRVSRSRRCSCCRRDCSP